MKRSLVWFGLYICPAKPKPVYRVLGKREGGAGVMGSRAIPEMLKPFSFGPAHGVKNI